MVDATVNGAVPVATFDSNVLATTLPAVVKLPPDTLPVAVINPPVPKLPTLALPVAFNVPATFTPVLVTTTTFAVPVALILTLPFADGILTLLLPFTIVVELEILFPLTTT